MPTLISRWSGGGSYVPSGVCFFLISCKYALQIVRSAHNPIDPKKARNMSGIQSMFALCNRGSLLLVIL